MKEMRRKDRQLSSGEAMELLKKGEFGVLSTIGETYPYAVPVNYVVMGHSVYFHGSCEIGQKAQNIEANQNVCFTVVGETEVLPSKFSERYESVIVFGKAKMVDDTKKEQALEALLEKCSAGYRDAGREYLQTAKKKVSVYAIKIEQMTGKAHK